MGIGKWVLWVRKGAESLVGFPDARYFPVRTSNLVQEEYDAFIGAVDHWLTHKGKNPDMGKIREEIIRERETIDKIEEDWKVKPKDYENLKELWQWRVSAARSIIDKFQNQAQDTDSWLIRHTCENLELEAGKYFAIGTEEKKPQPLLT